MLWTFVFSLSFRPSRASGGISSLIRFATSKGSLRSSYLVGRDDNFKVHKVKYILNDIFIKISQCLSSNKIIEFSRGRCYNTINLCINY